MSAYDKTPYIFINLLAGLRPRLWACEAATPRVEVGGKGEAVEEEAVEAGDPANPGYPPYIPYSAEINKQLMNQLEAGDFVN